MGLPVQLGVGRSPYAPELASYSGKLYAVKTNTDEFGHPQEDSIFLQDPIEGSYVSTPISSLQGVERHIDPTFANLNKYGALRMVGAGSADVRDQDAINYAARIGDKNLMDMALGSGMSEGDAKRAIAAINANKQALQADNAGIVDVWKNNVGVDLEGLKNAMFKPVVLGDMYDNETVREGMYGNAGGASGFVTGLGVRPEDADGVKQKYGGGFRDYSNLKWSPEYGLYNDNYFNQVGEVDTKGQGAMLIPMVIGMLAGGAATGALGGSGVAAPVATAEGFGAGLGAAELGTGAELGFGVGLGDAATASGAGQAALTGAIPTVEGTSSLGSLFSAPNITGNPLVDNALYGAGRGALNSAVSGRDPLSGALSGGIGGGFSSGFSDVLSGMGITGDANSALTGIGRGALRQALASNTNTQMPTSSGGGLGAYLASLAPEQRQQLALRLRQSSRG